MYKIFNNWRILRQVISIDNFSLKIVFFHLKTPHNAILRECIISILYKCKIIWEVSIIQN